MSQRRPRESQPDGSDRDNGGEHHLNASDAEFSRMGEEERAVHTLEALRQVTLDVATGRGLQERTARHVEHQGQQLDAMRGTMIRVESKVDRERVAREDFETRCLVEFARASSQMRKLDERMGQPPVDIERRSQQGEHTPEELAALEQGTGLAGVVGRLVAGQSKLTKRVGLVTVVGASVTPAIIEIIKLFGG